MTNWMTAVGVTLGFGVAGCTLDTMGELEPPSGTDANTYTGGAGGSDSDVSQPDVSTGGAGGYTGGAGGIAGSAGSAGWPQGGSGGIAGSGGEGGTAGTGGTGGGPAGSSGTGGAGGFGGGTAGTAGSSGTGGTAGSGGSGPLAPIASYYSDAPCPWAASLRYEVVNNSLLMACGAVGVQPNALFRSPALGQTGAWTKLGNSGGYPSNHIALNDQYYAVMHSSPHGFTIINGKTSQVTAGVNFGSISPLDPLYAQIKSTINNPSGAVLAGGKLCVATSNLKHADADPTLTTFYPGSVICMPYNYDGTVSVAWATAQLTSGLNPTGMALIDKDPVPVEGGQVQRYAVLSSNSYGWDPGDGAANAAMLDVCDAMNDSGCKSFNLGKITAQMSPTLTMTEDGASFLVGMQKPNAAFFGVKWEDGTQSYPLTMLIMQVKNFIYGTNVFGKIALITDAGVYGDALKGGALLSRNMDSNGWKGTLVTNLPGAAGPSVVVNTKHYVALTVENSTDAGSEPVGKVYETELSGLQ
ncbi:MAG: hypothetical protein WC956_00035 [bacterium]